jgi:ppGpp synthetase/RelA/SpoT-type nucleotidyltranferase
MNVVESVNWFEEIRPVYESATQTNVALLSILVKRAGLHAFIESRVKTLAGFEEKISRPGKAYINPTEEITDLSGIRIVLPSA